VWCLCNISFNLGFLSSVDSAENSLPSHKLSTFYKPRVPCQICTLLGPTQLIGRPYCKSVQHSDSDPSIISPHFRALVTASMIFMRRPLPWAGSSRMYLNKPFSIVGQQCPNNNDQGSPNRRRFEITFECYLNSLVETYCMRRCVRRLWYPKYCFPPLRGIVLQVWTISFIERP
jgi:hypothetical protein